MTSDKIGLIPAGGKGSRWGGYHKMLLPCGEHEWLLDRCIRALQLGGATDIYIAIREEDYITLTNHIALRTDLDKVFFVAVPGVKDFYEAFEISHRFGNRILFAMPDTYFPLDAFVDTPESDLVFGLHQTNSPERFGVLHNGEITNKSSDLTGRFNAWGTLEWSPAVSAFWAEQDLDDYTEALNLAIKKFGYGTTNLAYYYDMASWEHYLNFMKGL